MKNRLLMISSIALGVAACAHASADVAQGGGEADTAALNEDALPASAGDDVVVARGNEPGWRVTLGGEVTAFVLSYGERQFEAATPAPETSGASAVYRFADDGFILTIADTPCADDMSGAPYPKSAILEEVGGRTLNGCAGEPADLLTGDEWVVEDIGGKGVVDIARTTMQFGEDGRLTGSGACNRYGASYTITGEGLSIGRAISTRKACPPAIMDQENKFFDALEAIDRFEIDETGALVLFGGGERLLLARR